MKRFFYGGVLFFAALSFFAQEPFQAKQAIKEGKPGIYGEIPIEFIGRDYKPKELKPTKSFQTLLTGEMPCGKAKQGTGLQPLRIRLPAEAVILLPCVEPWNPGLNSLTLSPLPLIRIIQKTI